MAIARFHCSACNRTEVISVETTAEAFELEPRCARCGARLAWREVDHVGADPRKDRLYLRREDDA